MTQYFVIAALLSGSMGLMLFVIGAIFTGVVALGNKQHLLGWAVILFLPFSLIYCAMNWDKAAYSGKMVYSGAGLLCLTAIILRLGNII